MFKYRKLSEEKCKQLNRLAFRDPEQGGSVDFLKNNVAVISDDDYYCLFRFLPNHEFIQLQKYKLYALFYGDNYVVVSVHIEDGHEKIVGSVKHETMIIDIKKNALLEADSKLLMVLKTALVESVQNHFPQNRVFATETLCTVIYDGREI